MAPAVAPRAATSVVEATRAGPRRYNVSRVVSSRQTALVGIAAAPPGADA
jgi:hypothetical protein